MDAERGRATPAQETWSTDGHLSAVLRADDDEKEEDLFVFNDNKKGPITLNGNSTVEA